jgi:hypothetical protein
LKVVIVRETPEKTKHMMAAQFPKEWKIITIGTEELTRAVGDADVIIPEGAVIDHPVMRMSSYPRVPSSIIRC